MEQYLVTSLKAGLAALLLLQLGSARAAGPPPAPLATEAVVLTGWLHVEDLTMKDAVVEVVVNGVTTLAPVSESGRFTVTLPADADARLRFEKPGHLAKELLVDTRYAQEGVNSHKVRKVKFAMIMELERHMAGFTYAGPVGSIGFDENDGGLAVEHTNELVSGKRHAAMVF